MAETATTTTPSFLIPFRVYTLPHGRQSDENFACESEDIQGKASDVIAAGYRFEAEVLRNGTVSVTCHDIEGGQDVAIEICTNGPAVNAAIPKLVKDAYKIACL